MDKLERLVTKMEEQPRVFAFECLKSGRTSLRTQCSKPAKAKRIKKEKPKPRCKEVPNSSLLSTGVPGIEDSSTVTKLEEIPQFQKRYPLQRRHYSKKSPVNSTKPPSSLKHQIQIQNSDTTLQIQTIPLNLLQYIQDMLSHALWKEQHAMDRWSMDSSGLKMNKVYYRMLVNWILSVFQEMGASPSCIFLTVELLSRLLTVRIVQEGSESHLVIVACMFIACKYEETKCPHLNYFVKLTDGEFSGRNILDMQNDVLGALQFDLLYSSPLYFIDLMSNVSSEVKSRACAIAECSLLDLSFRVFKPSVIADCSVALACQGLGYLPLQCPTLSIVTECKQRLAVQLSKFQAQNPNAIFRKSKDRYLRLYSANDVPNQFIIA